MEFTGALDYGFQLVRGRDIGVWTAVVIYQPAGQFQVREDDQRLTHCATRSSEASFARVWDNDEYADYDRV